MGIHIIWETFYCLNCKNRWFYSEKETKNQKKILNGRQEVQDYDNGKYCSIPGTFTQK